MVGEVEFFWDYWRAGDVVSLFDWRGRYFEIYR